MFFLSFGFQLFMYALELLNFGFSCMLNSWEDPKVALISTLTIGIRRTLVPEFCLSESNDWWFEDNIKKFNVINFVLWKMQWRIYYIKKLYLPRYGIAKKPKLMYMEEAKVIDRTTLTLIWLLLFSSIAFQHCKWKDYCTLKRMYQK